VKTRFPYKPEVGLGGEPIYRPVAEALLRGPGGKEMWQYLYVDSGADHTLVPYRVGRFLGFSAADAEIHEIHGISGAVGVIYCTAELEIGGIRFPARVAWAQLEEVPLLLGRTDVFDRFEITFRQHQHVVEFKPVPDSS
jgi:hypothetical protein